MVYHPPKKNDITKTNNMRKEISAIKNIEYRRQARFVNNKGPLTYRNFYDIIFDIMYTAKLTNGHVTKARIATLARLSYNQTKLYIRDILIPQELVTENPQTGDVGITKKGNDFLVQHEKSRLMLGMKSYEERKQEEAPWLHDSLDRLKIKGNLNNS